MSFLVNWVWRLVGGMFARDEQPTAPLRILLLGLDNAGKTTLLTYLRDGFLSAPTPTLHPSSANIELPLAQGRGPNPTLPVTVIDMGGHDVARPLWRDYYAAAAAVIFVVDGADAARLPEAATELQRLLREVPHTLPFLVLCNKCDLREEFALAEGNARASIMQAHLQSARSADALETLCREAEDAAARPLEEDAVSELMAALGMTPDVFQEQFARPFGGFVCSLAKRGRGLRPALLWLSGAMQRAAPRDGAAAAE